MRIHPTSAPALPVAAPLLLALLSSCATRAGGVLPAGINARDGEVTILSGPANHFVGIEAVGGQLFLTNQRLVFASHPLNLQTHKQAWPLEQIESLGKARTYGADNKLVVALKSGAFEEFVVNERPRWIDEIERQRLAAGGASTATGNTSTSPETSTADETPASVGCRHDMDCKGDRVCEAGACVSPR